MNTDVQIFPLHWLNINTQGHSSTDCIYIFTAQSTKEVITTNSLLIRNQSETHRSVLHKTLMNFSKPSVKQIGNLKKQKRQRRVVGDCAQR